MARKGKVERRYCLHCRVPTQQAYDPDLDWPGWWCQKCNRFAPGDSPRGAWKGVALGLLVLAAAVAILVLLSMVLVPHG